MAGKYNSEIGSADCTECGAGKYGVVTGQTAEASCTACGAGKYRLEYCHRHCEHDHLSAGLNKHTLATRPSANIAFPTHLVKMAVSLPLTKADFSVEKQSRFKQSTALVAGVSINDVMIDKIDVISDSRRRLLVASILIDTCANTQSKGAADEIGSTLTTDNLKVI